MPIYAYKCNKCGGIFDHLALSFSEPAPKCPNCGAKNPKKQLSAFSVGSNQSGDISSCPTGTCPTGTCSLE
ncbi:MAG: zinc ribbon domain-containing protein [Thermodesulfobacteriota bacterium]|nr:zinc ribbon domain-containing protein [Thermodesulfobacteriota bacterium]